MVDGLPAKLLKIDRSVLYGVVGGLSLIIGKLFDVTPEIIGSLGLTATAATLVADHLNATQARNKKARENDWFLVHQARSKLEE